MNILLTGFNPFSGSSTNPSWDMLQGLPATVGGFNLVRVQLPTEYYRATEVFLAAVEEHSPVAILAFGLSGLHNTFRIESLGINLGSSSPDNAGVYVTGLYRPDDGERVAHWIPNTQDPVTWLAGAPVKGETSIDAGTYVCNSICYDWGREVRRRPELGSIRCWFAHVPASTESGISGYQKPLADLTASVLAMVQGVVTQISGTPPVDPEDPEDPEPPAPFIAPAPIAQPQKSWWPATSSTVEFALFKYVGGLTLGSTRKGSGSTVFTIVQNVTGTVTSDGVGPLTVVDVVVGKHPSYPGLDVLHYTFNTLPSGLGNSPIRIKLAGTAANGALFEHNYSITWPSSTGVFVLDPA